MDLGRTPAGKIVRWKMLRERLDEYLDGGLEPADRRELEAMLAADLAAAGMLARMKAQRALRAAAFASYLPTAAESKALAQRVLAEAHDAPVGYIGYWVRRGAAVAAAIVIVVGTFAAGRMTASPAERVEVRTVYNVAYTDMGEQRVVEFATMEERNDFVKELEQRGGIEIAYLTPPGQL
jgi:anti-sigma factor RsiW